jgi:hypothetical protein
MRELWRRTSHDQYEVKQRLDRGAAELRVESSLTELAVRRMINALSDDPNRKGHYRELGQGD